MKQVIEHIYLQYKFQFHFVIGCRLLLHDLCVSKHMDHAVVYSANIQQIIVTV